MQETQELRVQSLGWEDSPGVGNGNPLRYSCLENPMDRGARQATVHGVMEESDMTERLHFQGCILSPCLFNFCAEYIMRNARLEEAQAGIKIAGRYHLYGRK